MCRSTSRKTAPSLSPASTASARSGIAAHQAGRQEAEIGDTIPGKRRAHHRLWRLCRVPPGQDGLVHISQLAPERVDRVEDVVELGDEVLVMMTDKDRDGKYRLSRKAVIARHDLEEARDADPAIRGGGRGGRGGGARDGGWPRRQRRSRRRRD